MKNNHKTKLMRIKRLCRRLGTGEHKQGAEENAVPFFMFSLDAVGQ
jgi:hypothetical protein